MEFDVSCFWFGKTGWRKHEQVRDRESKVGELGVVFALGDVPGVDFAVLMTGQEGGAVVADLQAEGRG